MNVAVRLPSELKEMGKNIEELSFFFSLVMAKTLSHKGSSFFWYILFVAMAEGDDRLNEKKRQIFLKVEMTFRNKLIFI